MSEKEIVGTVVGVTNPREFYFSITPNKVRLQDLVAVDTFRLDDSGNKTDEILRVWAKVGEIERINPLFPQEAGQELAFQQTSAFDTVISLSREMITAKCRVLGIEQDGELQPLTYPLQPASSVYVPEKNDVEQLIVGEVPEYRQLHIGHQRSKSNVKICIDGHAIVARHLAVLAATGAGKTVTVRRILEELIECNYPILIFDPHGDYVGLQVVFPNRVTIYTPTIDLTEESPDTIIKYIQGLSGEVIEGPQEDLLVGLLELLTDKDYRTQIEGWMDEYASRYQKNILNLASNHFWAIMGLASFLVNDLKRSDIWDDEAKPFLANVNSSLAGFRDGSMFAIIRKTNKAGKQYNSMRKINQYATGNAIELPNKSDLGKIIKIGRVSIISLEGYSDELRQSIVATIVEQLLEDRVDEKIPRFLTVIEEAHNFIPGYSEAAIGITPSLPILKRVATEGRKYGMGLILISQRPSRVDSTILSQCNSYIIMKIINPADQRYVRDVVESIGEEDAAILPDLATGEALITGQCVRFPMLAKIEMPKSVGKHEEEDFIKGFLPQQQSLFT
ncbi:ATP-binding protein [Candidatus Poribacteria bacterium]|nr:ATP-binding protein [Candidatus Poribacteria bacterium]